jgi:PAS domain S-box-containing protein
MPLSHTTGSLGLNPQQLFTVCLALTLLWIGAYTTVQLIEQRYQRSLEHSLTAVLDTTMDSLHLWKEEEHQIANSLAQEEYIRDAALALLLVPRNQKSLLASDAHRQLRRLMKPHLIHYQGYFLIAPDNVNLASSRDSNVGIPNLLIRYPKILKELWNGRTRLTPIQFSDVSLTTEIERKPQPGDKTLFVGAPVKDNNGTVIALLTLRIDPYKIIFPLTAKGKLGDTGECYFFDKYGILLSSSRFDKQLIRIGLLEQGQSSTANLRLSDPGIDLSHLKLPPTLPDNLPLTKMANSAIKGENGVDVNGYRDYRGVPVIGAWRWDKQLHIGLAMEQDVADAYGLFNFVRVMIYIGSTIATITLLALVKVFLSGKQKLAQLQARLQAIVETATDGIVVISEKGVIESVNPAMESIFGYNAVEMLGNNMKMLMLEPFRSQHTGYLEHYRRNSDSKRIGVRREVDAKHKDGIVFPIDLTINRLELASGLQFAAVIRDISERKKAEENILKAQQEAIAANRTKSTFLATMSHEIRTPLNGVVSTIDMLTHTNLLPPQRDLVATAQDSTNLLQRIIDDILDFSKIEAGRLELEMVPTDLEPLVEKLSTNLQHIATPHGVELLIYIDPTLPQIKCDPVRLRQILYNLAGNAVKFSSNLPDRSGQVMISVSLQRRLAGKADISFQVSDNGIGMSSEVQKRLFRPFVQGEGETTRRFGGTGLGLVITQRLVEIMDGSIELESTEGKGSKFTVYISLEETSELPHIETSNLQGIKVVLLTCGETTNILTSYLHHAGAEVVVKKPGTVIAMLNKQSADTERQVVVIDTRCDKESSIALRNTLCNQNDDIDRHFLLLERGRRKYARPHEDGGMTLDLNVMRRHTLLNAVAALVGRESPEQPVMIPQNAGPDIPHGIEEAKNQGCLILLADDNQTNRKVISQQLSMLGYPVQTAENGIKALEMWRNGDYALLLVDCHMPDMDGYQLAETIRGEELEGSRIPIIAITADALKGTDQKCFASGMDAYLTKPLQLQQLWETLKKWTPRFCAAEIDLTKPQTTPKDSIDRYALGNLLGTQNPAILNDYYSDFLITNTPTVRQIETAFQNNDLSGVKSLAHKLKSSALTVGANDLADCCLALETGSKEDNTDIVNMQIKLLPRLFTSVKEWIEYRCKPE